jgi:2-oxoglutarate ferredoxin oxidoreductase subunit alpha
MEKQIKELDAVTIRFAGDSGDGMQLSGTQFSNTSASSGIDVNTFPDYPSEIRAPEGTLYGVSAYQVRIGSSVNTPGDKIDVLVVMNASSLKVNLSNLKDNGIIIANRAGFNDKNLKLANYEKNPLDDGSLASYQLFDLDITKQVHLELEEYSLSQKTIDKTKNIFALGLTYYIFDLPLDPTIAWLSEKFGKKVDILQANLRALQAGYSYGANTQSFAVRYHIRHAELTPGAYRNITGNNATALGLVAASKKARMPLFLGSYPITPATEIFHFLAGYKKYGVKTFQAEDEIGGICSAIGASFGGYLAATTTSGPGLSLKVEAMGLAVILELPLVIVDVQRAGPSTGLPTKAEQSDLFLAMFGRHGEAPIPVIAASTATDCFDMAVEAARLALKYMTPVIMLSDGYLAQGSEAWKIPQMKDLPEIKVEYATDPDTFAPYKRDAETLARMWAVPGTPGLEHRIGGLEKEDISGLVSHDPKNHEKMISYRKEKIERIANDIPDAEVWGEQEGDILILAWGSSYGAVKTAYDELRYQGKKLSYCHLKYLNPFPKNLGEILSKFKRVFIPENNMGQLAFIIRSKFLLPTIGFNIMEGRTFKAYEIEEKILELLNEGGK